MLEESLAEDLKAMGLPAGFLEEASTAAAGTVTVRMGLVWRTPREAARFPPP